MGCGASKDIADTDSGAHVVYVQHQKDAGCDDGKPPRVPPSSGLAAESPHSAELRSAVDESNGAEGDCQPAADEDDEDASLQALRFAHCTQLCTTWLAENSTSTVSARNVPPLPGSLSDCDDDAKSEHAAIANAWPSVAGQSLSSSPSRYGAARGSTSDHQSPNESRTSLHLDGHIAGGEARPTRNSRRDEAKQPTRLRPGQCSTFARIPSPSSLRLLPRSASVSPGTTGLSL